MNRSRLTLAALPTLTLWASPVPAAPPQHYSAGPNPIFGSPGAYGPAQFSYPAPGVYGSTNFKPFDLPPLSSGAPTYNVPQPPAEWPAVARARITVRLPADAKLWVDGVATKQTGPVRLFYTPPVLRAGLTYRYTFRAEWNQGNKKVVREAPVLVRATGSSELDFTKP